MGLLSVLGLTVIPLLARPKQDSPDVLLSRATERIEKLEADVMALRRRLEGLESVVRDLRHPIQAPQMAAQQHMIAQMQAGLAQANAYPLNAYPLHHQSLQQGLFANDLEGYCNCVPTRASMIA